MGPSWSMTKKDSQTMFRMFSILVPSYVPSDVPSSVPSEVPSLVPTRCGISSLPSRDDRAGCGYPCYYVYYYLRCILQVQGDFRQARLGAVRPTHCLNSLVLFSCFGFLLIVCLRVF